MGQQHSLAKGQGIPGLTPPELDNRGDTPGPFSAGQNLGPDRNSSATSSPASGVNITTLAGGLAVDQSQSVRAAIDSFIETCLAGGSEESTSQPKKASSERIPKNVEVITVPDDDGSDDLNMTGPDQASFSGGGVSTDGKDDESNTKQPENQKQSDSVATDSKKPESSSVSGGSTDGVSQENIKHGGSLSEGLSESVDKSGSESVSGESRLTPLSKPATAYSSNASEERVKQGGSPGTEASKQTKDSSDNSNASSDGVDALRLKALIDRVLDNSLGGGAGELNSVPVEQRLLTQIAAEEQVDSNKSQSGENVKKEEVSGASKVASDGKSERKTEPMTICFMEHIEKAVERSFSTITEEEERKEKEKVLAQVAKSENKPSDWSARTPKEGEAASAPPVTDGTISVQDIVDRVISQTEVISKLMTTSSGPSVQTESKPVVSSSGTFFPDRVTSQASSVQNPAQPHRETHKEEIPRETTGRRGRPRMRSPCSDHRDSAVHDHHSGNLQREALIGRRGPGSVPAEDYIQSMQEALAKYGQVNHPMRVPPYLPAGMTSAPSGTPVSTVQNPMTMAAVGGPHASHHSLQPHHQQAHHGTPASQPPPLLRVGPDDRPDPSHNPHLNKFLHPHYPSKSCGCTACVLYFGCKRDIDRARMLQSQLMADRNVRRMSPHSPHSAYQSSSSAVQPHSMKRSSADVRHPDSKQERVHPHYPYASYPSQSVHGQDHHPAVYDLQRPMPLPQHTYPEKQVTDTRRTEPYYPKPYERGEYGHHSQSKQGYDDSSAGEIGSGRHPYFKNMPTMKPVPGHSHSRASPQIHHHQDHVHTGRKEDDSLLDMTYRRDLPARSPAFEEEDKPLDLSFKKPSSTAGYYHERQDMRQRREEGFRYDGGDADYDYAGRNVSYVERPRQGEKQLPPSQHLHSLETSVENYFQKFQQHSAHRGMSSQSMGAGISPQSVSGGLPPHPMSAGIPHRNISAGAPPQNISVGVPPHNVCAGRPPPNAGSRSAVPLPPHHPTLPSQRHSPAIHSPFNNPAPQPTHTYPAEPLLSPGGRRPQLHPIPSPNPSTSLGSAASRPAPGFQSRGPTSSAPGAMTSSVNSVGPAYVPAMTTAMPVHGGSTPVLHAPVSSPQRSGSSGSNPISGEYLRPHNSRSVSPQPGNEIKGEDRRRGSISKHEPIQNILGNNNPQDILYLICRLCRQTYGSPYGFRKHFRNQHGFEPKAEHTLVQTISATKNARQMLGANTPTLEPGSPSQDSYSVGNKIAFTESGGYVSQTSSPRPESILSVTAASPANVNYESAGDGQSGEGSGVVPSTDCKQHGPVPRPITEGKGRSPGSGSGGSVGDEREDTKCLECPECGQAFQLNDFGSYKRHCRQHGQMRGMHGGSGVSQGAHACNECQRSFPDAHLLQEHMLHHQAQTSGTMCSVCRVSFASAAECQEHVQSVHGSSCSEPASSSSSVVITTKSKGSSASSNSDISSTSSVKHEPSTTAYADSSMPSFNLTVTTPSDLEIRRLPADPTVTSASPDSSSDNKKAQDNGSDSKKALDGSPVSSSEQNKAESVKTDSPKPASLDGRNTEKLEKKEHTKGKDTKTDYGDTEEFAPKSKSTPSERSSSSSTDIEESMEFIYTHKKLRAHRKRSASVETSGSDSKQSRLDTESPKVEKTQQNIVSSASDKGPTESEQQITKTVAGEKPVTPAKKTEARHQMPLVWDRVTRSQAGKNSRSSDYS